MDVSAALRVMGEVNRVVIGKKECIVKAMTAILAGGHILIEDIPGVGKTTMAMAFSRAMELTCHRVQFTPCTSSGSDRVFHVSERYRSVCLSKRRSDVQPLFSG